MIRIYGSPRTSATRCYLVLEELGLPFEPISVDLLDKKEQRSLEFLKLNPNGKVPCLIDGDVVLWESLAITQYLCDRHRPEWLGRDAAERARATQWSLWGNYELQQPMIDIFIQTYFVPEARRDHDVVARAQKKLPGLLKILDEALAESPWLAGDAPTVADFNVVTAFQVTKSLKLPTDEYRRCTRWYEALQERPAFGRWLALRDRAPREVPPGGAK